MPRPAKFSSEQILDHAVDLVAQRGPQRVTIAAIARSMGAPSGSIYHRFSTRDLIMARAWVRTVRRAQDGFIAQLALPDVRAAAYGAAAHVPRWARDHETDARFLLLHRREQLAEQWPSELGSELAELNAPLRDALGTFMRRLPGRNTRAKREAMDMALLDLPYGVTRRHLLSGRTPPELVDQLLASTCEALLFAPH